MLFIECRGPVFPLDQTPSWMQPLICHWVGDRTQLLAPFREQKEVQHLACQNVATYQIGTRRQFGTAFAPCDGLRDDGSTAGAGFSRFEGRCGRRTGTSAHQMGSDSATRTSGALSEQAIKLASSRPAVLGRLRKLTAKSSAQSRRFVSSFRVGS